MKLSTIPPGLAGKIVKIPPALGTNQIAGFGGFRPLASLEKDKFSYALCNWTFTNKLLVKGQNDKKKKTCKP